MANVPNGTKRVRRYEISVLEIYAAIWYIAENFNRLSRVHERYRRQTTDRQTDGRLMTYKRDC